MVSIGKFHVAAHQESCRSRYSYYYLPGSGMTDGEFKNLLTRPNSHDLNPKIVNQLAFIFALPG